MSEVDVLAQLRTEFLYGGKDVSESERAELLAAVRQYFYEAMGKGDFVSWVAAEHGKIVASCGYAVFTQPPTPNNLSGLNAYVSNMYTIPEWRGRGIATKLFGLTCNDAKARGCERMTLIASEMGRPIYRRYGFHDSGTTMTYVVSK